MYLHKLFLGFFFSSKHVQYHCKYAILIITSNVLHARSDGISLEVRVNFFKTDIEKEAKTLS